MEVQPSPSPAMATETAAETATGAVTGTATPTTPAQPRPSPVSSTQVMSPAKPQPNPATHYPNGLPRSINGLKSNGVNGTGSSSSASGRTTSDASTPPVRPSPMMATPGPVMPHPSASASTSAPAPTPASASAPAFAPTPTPHKSFHTTPISQTPPTTQAHRYVQRQSSSLPHKISIVDPPSAHLKPRSTSHPQGFPSPKREHHLENPKYMDDLSRLTHAVQQSVPAAVRRVVRDNWEKSLLGSEFHSAFLLNAVIHHCNGVIIRRSIKDFGAKMVSESKHEIVAHLQSADLDEVVDDILAKASDYFLDRALEKRLRTIEARSLINALARAERLGYENSDALDDQIDGAPRFNPAPTSFNPSVNLNSVDPNPRSIPMPSPSALPHENRPRQVLQCPLCWRKFDDVQPHDYHVQKQVCTKDPPSQEGFPFSCRHCGAGFITKVGQQYHLNNHVCGEHGTMPATPKAPATSGSPIILSSGGPSPVPFPSSTVPQPLGSQHQFHVPSQYATTPIQSKAPTTPTPNSSTKDNPYAHLNASTRERLEEELRQAELTYSARFREAEHIPDLAQRQTRLEGLHNSFSTKQSIIRKKYGVRLRNRRTKAEIDSERLRMGWKHESLSQPEGTPSAKRQRTDDGPEEIINHLTVSEMTTGLRGSNATAATVDPTLPKPSPPEQPAPAQNSLSSFQRKGYRVSSHHAQPKSVSPTDTKMEEVTPPRIGSASGPVIIEDDRSESTDDDSNDDIPASLPPPRRTSGTPPRGLAAAPHRPPSSSEKI